MSTSYLTLVNNAINESGADLATFATNGSDWSTTTDSLRLKFKTWVARAWKEIQQDSFDLSFMEEQAVVNIDPGVMFYTDGTPIASFDSFENTSVDILDQDASTAISAVPFGTIYDLTGTATNTKPFGYFNVVTTASTPISWSLKPGAEYFSDSVSATFTNIIGTNTNNITNYVDNRATYGIPINSGIPADSVICNLTVNGHTYVVAIGEFFFTAVGGNSAHIDILAQSADAAAIVTDITAATTMSFTSYFSDSVVYVSVGAYTRTGGSNIAFGSLSLTTYAKGYIHSWKSFDFSEETGVDDFQENIKEIDQKSFKIINYFQAAPTGEIPLTYSPWEVFSPLYDISSVAPGIPRLMTRDNQNRFRFYPHPYQKMTLKFDYIRTPQILSAYTDIPKGIDDDIVDMIMWKAIMYYGEYDEQPSVIARANKNWKNYQFRFDQKYRQKFHMSPKRLW